MRIPVGTPLRMPTSSRHHNGTSEGEVERHDASIHASAVGGLSIVGVLIKRLGLVIAGAIIITAPLSAHHSPAAFATNSQIIIQGTVSRLSWTNPHVYIYVKGTIASGKPAEWMIETDPIPILTRSGW